jgi:ElaB/YqjD/DUF883 family membrane-anchored ribosome-binding protein
MPVKNFDDGRLTPVDELDSSSNGGDSAKEKAQDAAAQAKSKVQEVAAPAKEIAGDVAGQAKSHAQAAAAQAKDKASAQVDERTTQLGGQVEGQAQSLHGVADTLREQGNEGPAKVAEQVGERVQGAAEYLKQADGEQLVEAATSFARENPGAAAAVGAAAGFVAGRVLKASTPDEPGEQASAPSEPSFSDPGQGAA